MTVEHLKSLRAAFTSAAALCLATSVASAHINEHLKLLAPDGAAGDRAGFAVAIAEDLAAVGSPGDDDLGSGSGAVNIYVRNGASWNHEAKILPPTNGQGQRFGAALALSGDKLLVGAPENEPGSTRPGSAYVYVRTGTVWTLEASLDPSDGLALDNFGGSVALTLDSALVGAPEHDAAGPGSGAAYVFVLSGGSWSEQAKLVGADTDPGDRLGASVSIDEDRAALGAPNDSDLFLVGGAAYVFDRSGTLWTETAKVLDPTGQAGDGFGSAVAVHEDFLAVGAPRKNVNGADSGSLLLFDWDGLSWVLRLEMQGPGSAPGDQLGGALSVDHDLILAGARFDDTGSTTNSGSALLVVDEVTSIDIEVLIASDAADNDELGWAVGVSECWGIVGAYKDDDFGAESGAAYVFVLAHTPVSYCTAGVSASGCTALISGSGFPSATATSGFSLMINGAEGAKDGLFFIGTNGQQANPWGSGTSYQCVVPPVFRTGLLTSAGTVGACDGRFTQDLNALWCPGCPKPAKNPGPGAVVQAQFWYRDPLNTSNQTTSLSNALEFEVCP